MCRILPCCVGSMLSVCRIDVVLLCWAPSSCVGDCPAVSGTILMYRTVRLCRTPSCCVGCCCCASDTVWHGNWFVGRCPCASGNVLLDAVLVCRPLCIDVSGTVTMSNTTRLYCVLVCRSLCHDVSVAVTIPLFVYVAFLVCRAPSYSQRTCTEGSLSCAIVSGIVLGLPGIVCGMPGIVPGQPGIVLGLPGIVLGRPGIVLGLPGIVLGLPGAG